MALSRGSSLALGLLALALAAGTASAQRHGGGGGGGRDNDRPGFNSSVFNGGRARIAPRSSGIGVGYTRPVVIRDRGPVYRPPVYCPPSRPHRYGGGSYGGGGISIGGSYRDDNFGISIGINTPLRRDCGPAYCPPVRVPCEPVVYVPSYRPRYVETYVVTQPVYVPQPVYVAGATVPTTVATYQPYGYAQAPVVVQPQTIIQQPQTVVQQPDDGSVRTLPAPQPDVRDAFAGATSYELGVGSLQAGDYSRAVNSLRAHIRQHADDAKSMRLLSIALLADGRPDDAAATMRSAYRADPRLSTERLDPLLVGMSQRELRDMVSRAVIQANRDNSASSWLLVSVLMQAEGRDELAAAMLDRGSKQGLEPGITDALAIELKR